MSKVTVGFCKSKGVEFIEGDAIRINNGVGSVGRSVNLFAINNNTYVDSEIAEFAWRENTGEQPYDGDMFVEVELYEGTRDTGKVSDFCRWNDIKNPEIGLMITKYRPHLPSLQKEFDEMNDKQETKMTLRESYAHAQLENEAFDREFECCRKMKSAKPEPAPHPELLGSIGEKADEVVISPIRRGHEVNFIKVSYAEDRLRKERDDLKERCSDLDLQVDTLEWANDTNVKAIKAKDATITALKECLRLKELECRELDIDNRELCLRLNQIEDLLQS